MSDLDPEARMHEFIDAGGVSPPARHLAHSIAPLLLTASSLPEQVETLKARLRDLESDVVREYVAEDVVRQAETRALAAEEALRQARDELDNGSRTVHSNAFAARSVLDTALRSSVNEEAGQ